VEILAGECKLQSNYLVPSSFLFGVGLYRYCFVAIWQFNGQRK